VRQPSHTRVWKKGISHVPTPDCRSNRPSARRRSGRDAGMLPHTPRSCPFFLSYQERSVGQMSAEQRRASHSTPVAWHTAALVFAGVITSSRRPRLRKPNLAAAGGASQHPAFRDWANCGGRWASGISAFECHRLLDSVLCPSLQALQHARHLGSVDERCCRARGKGSQS
jgi:hypothetical protein